MGREAALLASGLLLPSEFSPAQLAQHSHESPRISTERSKEFLVSALDKMDELSRETATRGGWSQRVGARVGWVIGATHELLSLERPEHLRGRHGVGMGVAREHDLCHGLVLLGERRHAREEHHLEVGETGVAKRAALTALPAIHGLPEENARARGGRGELRRETFWHRRGLEKILRSVLIISVLTVAGTRNFDKKTLRDKITVLIIRRRVMMWHRSCPISVWR
jgi:hypothetical protein